MKPIHRSHSVHSACKTDTSPAGHRCVWHRACGWFSLVVAIVTISIPHSATAAPILLVDQQQTEVEGSSTNSGFAPIGQTFTPTFSGIDWAEFMLVDPNGGNALGGIFEVRVRENDGAGSILGTSQQVALEDDWDGLVQFFFDSTISLTPSSTYALELFRVSGEFFNLRQGPTNSYAGGQGFWSATENTTYDFYFREGLLEDPVVPEPSSLALMCCGVIGLCGYGVRKHQNGV